MSGSGTTSGGHTTSTWQSKSLGQSTLKENSTADRIGSKPSGGCASVDEATSCSVYREKSPAVSVRTTSTCSDSGKARKKSCSAVLIWPWVTSACEASEAFRVHTTCIFVMRTPPLICTLAADRLQGVGL